MGLKSSVGSVTRFAMMRALIRRETARPLKVTQGVLGKLGLLLHPVDDVGNVKKGY